ncbi:hypothetical protein [Pseudomonas sp. BF-R-12]|uniref:hypothetical protein n=1 Tax=Pseudomonas sp. BF-R-12 TaxID=2832363 RepID=UPI001CBFC9E9|nr:hypothetical protein [Pseudomonas sp. BF-R-12]
MPTENKPADPGFDLNTPDGGRGYIDNLFKTVLKRHDYRQYINERLAGDFACTLAQHFEEVKAREQALQQRLNAADQQIDDRAGTCEWSREDDSGIWHSGCGVTWSFHDDGPEENGMHFCHSCGKTLVVEAAVSEPERDDDWHMNPCKQGHRDVGASGGVAHCYTCGEEITATTTQEAFEQWNATHAAVDAAPEAKP